MGSKEEKLRKAAEYIASAVYPSLELEKDTEAALRRVRALTKAELERCERQSEGYYHRTMIEAAVEQCRRDRIDPRDVYF